jgi:hypothetical protein
MGSNKSGKQVSFKKIMTSPRISVSIQYKKDNRCLPARTQLPTNAMLVHYPSSPMTLAHASAQQANLRRQ